MNTEEREEKVNHPPHYAGHKSGVEPIDIAEHLSFNFGNALKYVWRAKLKGTEILDLEKSLWYLERQTKIGRLAGQSIFLGELVPVLLFARKALDQEPKESALGKFLQAIVSPEVHLCLSTTKQIIQDELKLIRGEKQ
jgi:hypothetical protein